MSLLHVLAMTIKQTEYDLSRLILAKHKEAIASIKHISTKNAHRIPLTLSISRYDLEIS